MTGDGGSAAASDPAELVAAQFPGWAGLPLARVDSWGTDNTIYRLGADLVVRLPRSAETARFVLVEREWLPRLAPELPLRVPEVCGTGEPGAGFPYPWAVYRWLDGTDLAGRVGVELPEVAVALGGFLAALWRVDPAGGPRSRRAEPVSVRDDAEVRDDIRQLAAAGWVDAAAATAVSEAGLAVPWTGEPAWIHGDLLPGNLLASGDRLTAVIDFGLMGVGDPAGDLLPAWTLLNPRDRAAFRDAAGADDATWIRGRAWALKTGLGAVRVYHDSNPALAVPGRHALARTTADVRRTDR